jgi:nicotinamide-nucleotide adenylyltransferase
MPSEIIGLYIGKFQPFHNGHLFAIRQILPKVSSLIIVIGSSQYSHLEDQPFSSQERRQMIEQTLASENINNVSIIEVPDIHDNKNWVEHLRKYVQHFDVVFTNNQLVEQLFVEKSFSVAAITMQSGVSGTFIRHKLATHEKNWRSLVSAATGRIVEDHFNA